MPDKEIHRFRFTTDHGDAYAVAVLDDGMWRVGFSFRSPLDGRNMRPTKAKKNGAKVKKKYDLGYLIAENRTRKGRLGASYAHPQGAANEIIQDALRRKIIAHLLRGTGCDNAASIAIAFGVRPYLGDEPGTFETWITGPFAEQFRERYAPGVE